MIREEYEDRAFSENIDRLLAGESVDLGPSANDDSRTALDFAQMMVGARPTPNPRFKADLKARLLHQLADTEEKRRIAAKQSWIHRLLHQPAWQAAAAAVFLVVVVTTLWATGVFRQEAVTIPPGTMLAVVGDTNKTAYAPGEVVGIEVTLRNVTDEPFTVDRFPPILSLMRTDTGEAVYTFGAGSTIVTLDPGEEEEFTVRWDQRDARGALVPAGGYFLELEDIDYQGQTIKLTFTSTVRFDIRPSAPS